jgi:hypothetical protein
MFRASDAHTDDEEDDDDDDSGDDGEEEEAVAMVIATQSLPMIACLNPSLRNATAPSRSI